MNFWYFLCCCNCFGLFGRRKLLKTVETSRKRKNIDLLETIASDQKPMPITSDPTQQRMTELTDIIQVPTDQFPTEESVINWYGFKLNELIGSGSFANVYKAIHIETGLDIGCKKILIPDTIDHKYKPKDKTEKKKKVARLQDIKNELFILQQMKHPNVIKMIRHFIVDNDKKLTLYVFMQFASKGTLTELLNSYGPFEEHYCKHWFAQLLSAMSYMHGKGMAHRDLKLSNILLDDSHDVLISDFGLSRIAYRKSKGGVIVSNTYCGTPPFMAPELFERKPYNAFLVDVWALGVILYLLLCREYPFIINDRQMALKKMKDRKWNYSIHMKFTPSKSLTNILNMMLEPDISQRATIDTLRKHQWIRKEFKKVDKRAQKIITKRIKSLKTTQSMKTTQKDIN